MSDAAMETIEDMSAENTRQRHRIAVLEAENARLRGLAAIYEDHLTHAQNTIEDMKALATDTLARAARVGQEETENG